MLLDRGYSRRRTSINPSGLDGRRNWRSADFQLRLRGSSMFQWRTYVTAPLLPKASTYLASSTCPRLIQPAGTTQLIRNPRCREYNQFLDL